MAVKFSTTKQDVSFIRVLVFGASGAGKTTLIKTAPKPIVITSENKLLALKDQDINVFVVETAQDLDEVYNYLISPDCDEFKTVCFDSVSDIAEKVLTKEKEGAKDKRQAYGSYVDLLLPRIEKLASIPNKNVYMICHEERVSDDFTGINTFCPGMPGKQLGAKLPYKFDYVLALRIGKTDDGEQYHYLQTTSDLHYSVKGDRDKLDSIEEPNLSNLFNKLLGYNQYDVNRDGEITPSDKNKNFKKNVDKKEKIEDIKKVVVTKPIETKPIETKPIETKPIETKPEPIVAEPEPEGNLFNFSNIFMQEESEEEIVNNITLEDIPY